MRDDFDGDIRDLREIDPIGAWGFDFTMMLMTATGLCFVSFLINRLDADIT